MALVTIASNTTSADIISGSIIRPLVGIWTADLVVDNVNGSGFDAGTQVTIASEDGYSLVGIVAEGRSGDFIQTMHIRVLGGAGGMAKPVSARNYVQPGAFVRDVLNGIAQDSGETLSSTIDASFVGSNLTAWSTKAELASHALLTLIGWVGASMNWRILADGTLWIGAETWPSASVTYDLMGFDPKEAVYTLGLQSPAIDPGTSIDGVGNVSRVEIAIEAASIRARVWVPVDDLDRGNNADLEALITQKTGYVDYYALYQCQVVSQSADMTTVDLQPQGAHNKGLLAGFQRVPLRLAPGIQVQFTPGATVMLGWDGGNPSSPFACLGVPSDAALKVGVQAMQVQIQATASLNMSGATLTASSSGPAALKGSTTTLGNNPIVTPVLTVGAVDYLGIPITPAPTATGTVLAG